MHPLCTTKPSCSYGCFGVHLPESSKSVTSSAASALRNEFEAAMGSSICSNYLFTNHESLPSLDESFSWFTTAFPLYSMTDQADRIREQDYSHLSLSDHVCFDYNGHGLFSFSQQQNYCRNFSIASTSNSPLPPPLHSVEPPFFDISYRSVTLNSQLQYGGQESDLENKTRNRIMSFMNISEDDYTMVFAANQSSAFKLLADSYPFQSHRNLLTVYDYESEAVNILIKSSKKKGAKAMSSEFLWPSMGIRSGKLLKKVVNKRKTKNKGLFVFPLQSKVTGNRYSYLWMSLAQENGWHILLDACALGAKEMETLGLSIFKPDFLICSFFKVFGENPSGFACLFVKKSSAEVLMNSSTSAVSLGIVNLVPAIRPVQLSEVSPMADSEMDPKENGASEIEELESETAPETTELNEMTELKFTGLDHADSIGLILISTRARYLINWLVNALMSLQHPHSEIGQPPVRIYGPKIKFDRGPAVAFNVFDWKGEKIDPVLVQKLADRHSISLSYAILRHIWIPDKPEEESNEILEMENRRQEKRAKPDSGICVVTAALGLLTNFQDVYRLWAFIARFLDADFVEKERWRYTALNQNIIEV